VARKRKFVRLLLLVPYLALIWVPFYDRALPDFAGIPFFYWYQLMWIPLGAAFLLPVYWVERRAERKP
jgi:hypothetical protein